MSRIEKKFKEVLRRRGKAFIPYVMAGDPSLERTREMVAMLEECGADIIELGVPFSDPLADGPTIQGAAQRALGEGVTLGKVLDLIGSLRQSTQIPIVLMTYYNLIFRYGEEKFVRDASLAGADGMIVPDLPPDEAGSLLSLSKDPGFDIIFLVAPTSTNERIKKVTRASRGFIYYVSITGITGSKLSVDPSIGSHIVNIRQISGKPVAVGFGISTPHEASEIARIADGVIVGSAIVKRVSDSNENLKDYLIALRKAIR